MIGLLTIKKILPTLEMKKSSIRNDNSLKILDKKKEENLEVKEPKAQQLPLLQL